LYRITFQQLSKVIKLNQDCCKEGDNSNKVAPDPAHPPKNKNAQLYKFTDENTVKGIFNKLTVIMISCVVLPVLI